MTARQDDALGVVFTNEFVGYVVRMQLFAVHAHFTNASSDELGNPGAKIENENAACHGFGERW